VRGEHNDRHLGVDLSQLAWKLDAALPQHLEIGHDQVATFPEERSVSFLGACCGRAT
jgi:hypothetical protein